MRGPPRGGGRGRERPPIWPADWCNRWAPGEQHRRRHHSSAVVNDLLLTATKAMLAGCETASTQLVNLALDELSK